jgi:hypothetical protein
VVATFDLLEGVGGHPAVNERTAHLGRQLAVRPAANRGEPMRTSAPRASIQRQWQPSRGAHKRWRYHDVSMLIAAGAARGGVRTSSARAKVSMMILPQHELGRLPWLRGVGAPRLQQNSTVQEPLSYCRPASRIATFPRRAVRGIGWPRWHKIWPLILNADSRRRSAS